MEDEIHHIWEVAPLPHRIYAGKKGLHAPRDRIGIPDSKRGGNFGIGGTRVNEGLWCEEACTYFFSDERLDVDVGWVGTDCVA